MPDLSQLSDEELLAMHARAHAAEPPAAIDLSKLSDADLLAMHAQAHAVNPLERSDAGGIADAAVRGATKGASLGFGDELYGLVGATVNPTDSGKGFWDRYHDSRDYARRRDAQAQHDHSGVFTGGEVAGGLASAFNPLTAPLNVGKGAGLIEAAGKGAIQGGIAGAGDAKEFTDIPSEAAHGAKVGGLVGGGLWGAGKVAHAVYDAVKPARAASVLLNVPEPAVERYIANPSGVDAARSRADIIQDSFLPRIEQLKKDVVGGSQASRDILTKEGQKMSGGEIADIFDSHADEIEKRAEGVMDDPRVLAAYKWLRGQANMYRPVVPAEVTEGLQGSLMKELESSGIHPDIASDLVASMPGEVDRQLSTNRVKDLVQNLQNRTQYETAPGQFHDVDDVIRQKVGSDVNAALKLRSPAYAGQMKDVARDTGLLSDVGDLAKSPQGFDNLLKRTQRGNTPHIMDTLNQFDTRTGGGMMTELENSAVKDALNKGYTNGSRAVNMAGGVAESIGSAIGGIPGKIIGKGVGVLGGASIDKYGGPMARGAVNGAAKVQSMLQSSEGLQMLGKFAGPLADAAQRGNQSLAVTHYILSQQQPEYSKMMNDNP